MKLPQFKGISIFWQTLILLVVTLIASQALLLTLIVTLPQPPPDFIGMSEIADILAPEASERSRQNDRTNDLVAVSFATTPPDPDSTMTSEPALSADLAKRIGVAPDQVRLFFEADRGRFVPFSEKSPGDSVPILRGEALFFNKVLAGIDTGNRWRIVKSRERPIFDEGLRRALFLISANFLALLPFAWFFTRRLARPIKRFAQAADLLGRDIDASPIPPQGPVELRAAAQTFNRMQARISDYLRERTAMIGAIAHDLRTPLARIAFRIENSDDAVREPILNDIEQMRAMISATLSFVKTDAQPKALTTVNLTSLIKVLTRQELDVGRDVKIVKTVESNVLGDAIALQRLFQNLIDNAITFGGSAQISIHDSNRATTVKVMDEGPGLPAEKLEAVFDPFVRVETSRNRATGGVGLGLTIARMIAVDHGGTLSLSNRPAGGLVASVSIPAIEPPV